MMMIYINLLIYLFHSFAKVSMNDDENFFLVCILSQNFAKKSL